MNPRLAKEFRALRLPWLLGVLAGLLAGYPSVGWEWLALVALACVTLLGAMSLGNEFQQRTFPLLLSQPLDRRRIWSEKLLVLGALTGTVGLALGLALWLGPRRADGPPMSGVDFLVIGAAGVALVCSAGFWTLGARSSIGGMVFTIAVLFALGIGVALGTDKLAPADLTEPQREFARNLALIFTWLAYAAVSLWLSWRTFAHLELKDAVFGEGALFPAGAQRSARWWNWLRIRPQGALRNLVRKELRLQKPAFLVAGVFALCWLGPVALNRFDPQLGYESLFLALVAVYVPVALGLAGSISQGEERTLGVAAWQSALPVAAWRQWLVKLAVAASIGTVLCVVLPGVLTWATVPAETREALARTFQSHDPERLANLVTMSSVLLVFFTLSFWAATLLGNTIRAVLGAVFGIAALFLCAKLAVWCAEQMGGLQTPLLAGLSERWRLRPEFFAGMQVELWAFAACAALVVVTALVQSLTQFRRSQVQAAAAVRCAAILVLVAFLGALWCADLAVSMSKLLMFR